jgi:RecB family exonuclease
LKNQRSKVPEKRRRDHDDDLRAENQKLRKEIKQLRKQLSRMHFREEEIQEFIEEFEVEDRAQEVELLARKCPKCKSAKIKILENVRGTTDYFICEACNGRGPLK